jgi:hypothetical protein
MPNTIEAPSFLPLLYLIGNKALARPEKFWPSKTKTVGWLSFLYLD